MYVYLLYVYILYILHIYYIYIYISLKKVFEQKEKINITDFLKKRSCFQKFYLTFLCSGVKS